MSWASLLEDEIALCPVWARWKSVPGTVCLPLIIRFPQDSWHLKLVMAEDWSSIDHFVFTIIDGNHQQLDITYTLVQHAAWIPQYWVGYGCVNIRDKGIPLITIRLSSIEKFGIPAVIPDINRCTLKLNNIFQKESFLLGEVLPCKFLDSNSLENA